MGAWRIGVAWGWVGGPPPLACWFRDSDGGGERLLSVASMQHEREPGGGRQPARSARSFAHDSTGHALVADRGGVARVLVAGPVQVAQLAGERPGRTRPDR